MFERNGARHDAARRRRGSALIPALMTVAMLSMLALSMLSATLSGARVVGHQGDEHRLTSAVESVGILATERLWSAYLTDQGGSAGTVQSLRQFLDANGVQDAGPGGPPSSAEGLDMLEIAGIPGAGSNQPAFDGVEIEAVRLVRRDNGDRTQLYVTVKAKTGRGGGLVQKGLERAVQLVYTVEPEQFEGFEYGVLANNVNCIFCHTVIDSTDRYYNTDPNAFGTFDRVKVGTLESLMLRDNWDGRPAVTDWDADSLVGGSVYVRGSTTDHDGDLISDWANLSFKSLAFDGSGHVHEDQWGDGSLTDFSPAGDPPQPGENLYLDYPTDYSAMPDGKLPTTFPPPFPDDGGIDPVTGAPSGAGAGNRRVDPAEFYATAQTAEGTISGGVINVSDATTVIDTSAEYSDAITNGNAASLPSSTTGNVILTGTETNPIIIDGDVAIDGDVIINGYVLGEGTIIASGNVYVPTDLKYLDGKQQMPGDTNVFTGPRTFGISPADSTAPNGYQGVKNALGLLAGGNVLLGDYLKPQTFSNPGQYDIVTGDSTGDWNFALAELSLFNRGEWAKTQPLLPGQGEDKNDPSSWTVPNPSYEGPSYVPRYYNFGSGDEIPVYNMGSIYFDSGTGTWKGDSEVPLAWDPSLLSIWDPSDTSNAALYDQTTGAAKAAISQLTPSNGWFTDAMQKEMLEHFESQRTSGTPMEIDALLYTNNAIFGIVHRDDTMKGQMVVNGSLVCPDLGLLAPGHKSRGTAGTKANPPGSPFKIGLQLNYDRRLKNMLNVVNPNVVTIKRALWNPAANAL